MGKEKLGVMTQVQDLVQGLAENLFHQDMKYL